MDWFDLFAVQGTLKSPVQHHSSKASILWHSAFSMVQPSDLHMTVGITIALTIIYCNLFVLDTLYKLKRNQEILIY